MAYKGVFHQVRAGYKKASPHLMVKGAFQVRGGHGLSGAGAWSSKLEVGVVCWVKDGRGLFSEGRAGSVS